jgi:MerR family transcriptional regulator, copper efflux regulator
MFGKVQSDDEQLTVARAAAYLGVSPNTLRNWDRSGKLKATRHPINGYRLYSRKQLDELIEKIKGKK